MRRPKAPFRTIEVVRMPLLERILAWGFRNIFRSNHDGQLLTAFRVPFAWPLNFFAWRQLRHRILAGEFDVVLRLMPMPAVLPSPFALFLRKASNTLCAGAAPRWFADAPGFSQPADDQKFRLRGLSGFCLFPVDVSSRGSDHLRGVPYPLRVCLQTATRRFLSRRMASLVLCVSLTRAGRSPAPNLS